MKTFKNSKLSRTLKMAAAAGALLLSSLSFASSINLNNNDVAIHGYDPVAYFTSNQAVEGTPEYTANHDGAIYHFSSAENRDRFKADPGHYAPQFGGYCAMGVALNKKFDIDPQAFRIVDNKLYLNLNKDVQKRWLTDTSGHIKSADRIWSGIEALPVAVVNEDD
ncbi:YHS domain-containing (seleno)protein [Oceanospirillum sediminis]|uniref:YHS domain-containing protein n=1 Tax=Oceanospirillum sediminis TaxID=2760088 RepID=A0A839IMG9_9GAMM|nr:YHS domain-containing (seleno)protein [Oceanospirillum sediminis]MBB1486091.1 YHS domain-containing protein [Oceanospirillum sediminis]